MPGGDGTGPMGFGPMTGRGAGYCAGYPVPGVMNQGQVQSYAVGGYAPNMPVSYGVPYAPAAYAGATRVGSGLGRGRGWGRARDMGRGRGRGRGAGRGRGWGRGVFWGPGYVW